jgi:hypothetical protein
MVNLDSRWLHIQVAVTNRWQKDDDEHLEIHPRIAPPRVTHL